MATQVSIPQLQIATAVIRLRGISPLIVHRFSEKARKQMEDKQQGKAAQKKEPKNPEKEFEAAKYKLSDGRDGFPAVGFKAAAVGACRFVDGLKMTEVRGGMHVMGEIINDIPSDLVALDCDEPEMRTDFVTISMNTRDIRYRPMYSRWAVNLDVRYNSNVLTLEQIVNLFNNAGFGVGVGEWRPSSKSGGQFGMFEVAGSDHE